MEVAGGGLKRAPLVTVLTVPPPSPPPRLLHLGSTDRCGVVVFSRAEPKPCQMRDGRSQ